MCNGRACELVDLLTLRRPRRARAAIMHAGGATAAILGHLTPVANGGIAYLLDDRALRVPDRGRPVARHGKPAQLPKRARETGEPHAAASSTASRISFGRQTAGDTL